MLPAFVAAASVGLYSVATNVSLIVYQLANTFAALVLPAAAGTSGGGTRKVIGSFWAAMAVAIAVALGLARVRRATARLRVRRRVPRVPPVAATAAARRRAVRGSLDHQRRHLRRGAAVHGDLPQLLGMVVTVIGLFVFLRDGGVTAAAMVSSVSYTVGVRRDPRGLPADHRHSPGASCCPLPAVYVRSCWSPSARAMPGPQ